MFLLANDNYTVSNLKKSHLNICVPSFTMGNLRSMNKKDTFDIYSLE